MWYEILPTAAVIFGAMTAGMAGIGFVNNYFLGRPSLRELYMVYQQYDYQRDMRLTGSAYKLQGLDAIPDANAKKEEQQ